MKKKNLKSIIKSSSQRKREQKREKKNNETKTKIAQMNDNNKFQNSKYEIRNRKSYDYHNYDNIIQFF